MKRVITYGTYDLLHYGHINLLKRAKALGDYLIVGITADDFDKSRGKINVQQSLIERIEAVRNTGIADEIIVEEYEGQKIDDIIKYNIDIFTVGSDWVGHFDYLNDYCEVVYLPRTEGVSSSEIRSEVSTLRLGFVGDTEFLEKVLTECKMVNGLEPKAIYSSNYSVLPKSLDSIELKTNNFDELLYYVDAVYIRSKPEEHFEQIKTAIINNKHVLCESPITINVEEWNELQSLAEEHNVVLMDAIKTAFATAYSRLLLQLKGGAIGTVVSVDATCTSLIDDSYNEYDWDNIHEWGPTALLPIFQLLGTDYEKHEIVAQFRDDDQLHDSFVKMNFVYPNAVASLKIGNGVKSEGELVVSGTMGYAYVPAPWWKPDYYEFRFENHNDNKRYFYPLEGEGIRYELLAFLKAIHNGRTAWDISKNVSKSIVTIMEEFKDQKSITIISRA